MKRLHEKDVAMSVRMIVVSLAVMLIVTITVFIGIRAGALGPLQAVGILIVTITVGIVAIGRAYRRKVRQAGYSTIGAYLRAVPRTDEEKRDAIDLALQGLLTCLVGLLLPPLLLIGALPLYYGSRKVLHASMGLGLVDDDEPPRA
jgi:hypothetical protein